MVLNRLRVRTIKVFHTENVEMADLLLEIFRQPVELVHVEFLKCLRFSRVSVFFLLYLVGIDPLQKYGGFDRTALFELTSNLSNSNNCQLLGGAGLKAFRNARFYLLLAMDFDTLEYLSLR